MYYDLNNGVKESKPKDYGVHEVHEVPSHIRTRMRAA